MNSKSRLHQSTVAHHLSEGDFRLRLPIPNAEATAVIASLIQARAIRPATSVLASEMSSFSQKQAGQTKNEQGSEPSSYIVNWPRHAQTGLIFLFSP